MIVIAMLPATFSRSDVTASQEESPPFPRKRQSVTTEGGEDVNLHRWLRNMSSRTSPQSSNAAARFDGIWFSTRARMWKAIPLHGSAPEEFAELACPGTRALPYPPVTLSRCL